MTTTKPQLLTADDLLRLHSEGVKGELIMGVLHRKVSSGLEHGEIVVNLGAPLHQFVRARRLGRVIGSDTGIQLEHNPDTVREPDLAFISAERMPLDLRERRYAQVVPDLVVEIVSPNDRPLPVFDKAQMWLRHGVRLVWITDPEARTITALTQSGPARTFTETDTLDGGDVLPGFTCPVRDIFEV
ncbi:MAG: Uma2 family endonuclease [Chloroflexota bacterium]|nr:Uma2 family endonuclease [Chloroflexota bacterium]MDE2962223.1 Uma2 family endonuclease [Chloroflexota bacterium]